MAVILCIITAGVMIYHWYNKPVDVADSTQDTHEVLSPVVAKTMEIYNSPEFQDEMKTLATARAMFELSAEKQSEAIDLSEQAMIAYLKSKDMADVWHNNQMYASSTSSR